MVNQRTFIHSISGKETTIINRQARHWVFILYDKEERQRKAVEKFSKYDNSIILCHDRSYDPKTGELKDKHYHCIFVGNNVSVYWKWTILDDLGLSNEDDHLFKTLSDLQINKKAKRFTIDSYIIYLTHMYLVDKEVYFPDEFFGGKSDYAVQVIKAEEVPEKTKILKVFDIIDSHFNTSEYYDLEDFYMDCNANGLFEFAVKKHSFFKSIIDNKNNKYRY